MRDTPNGSQCTGPSHVECGWRRLALPSPVPFQRSSDIEMFWSSSSLVTVVAKPVSHRARSDHALNRARPEARGRCRCGRRSGLFFGLCTTIFGPPPSSIRFSKRCARTPSQTWRLTGGCSRTRWFVADLLAFQARLLARAPRHAQAVLAEGCLTLVEELDWFEAQTLGRGLDLPQPALPATVAYIELLRRLDAAPYELAVTALWVLSASTCWPGRSLRRVALVSVSLWSIGRRRALKVMSTPSVSWRPRTGRTTW